jgi:predicted glutamine amidotransferase
MAPHREEASKAIMCELFALSASAAVDIKFSLAELARDGGDTGIHTDGWGVAFLKGRDVRPFREPVAAATSPWVQCLQTHALHSETVVAHIRHAMQGGISLANTQPFVRELGGRMHVFAHNGNISWACVASPRPQTVPAHRGDGLRSRVLFLDGSLGDRLQRLRE